MGHQAYLPAVYVPLIYCMIVLIGIQYDSRSPILLISQVGALKLSPQVDGLSKTNGVTSSKFRESIVQVRRNQQQQQLAQPQQLSSKFSSYEQQVTQQQPAQPVQRLDQRTVNELSIIRENDDIKQSSYGSTNVESVYGSVQGTPGIDFPNYSSIPNTKFRCDGVPFEPGMYADESTGCQVYHLCYDGRRESFLCGIGTVFNQAILNCDFWHSVDCAQSSLHYGVNSDFGKSISEPSLTNVQTLTKTRVAQSNQIVLPVNRVQQQVVINNQQSSLVMSQPSIFVSNERKLESTQRLSGGKTSFSRQHRTSFSSDRSQEKSAFSHSIDRLHNSQKTASSGFVSPGRKAVQLNRATGGIQQIKSAESSMIGALMSSDVTKSGKINPSPNNPMSLETHNQQHDGKFSGSVPPSDSSTSPSSKLDSSTTTTDQSPSQDERPVWKPYFRSKGKIPSSTSATESGSSSLPTAPVNGVSNQIAAQNPAAPAGSIASESDASTSVRPDPPAPTFVQPNQEPTFSSLENSQPPTTNETPKIPSINAPPPTEPASSTTSESPTETSPSVNIEPDVSPDLSTTTPRPETDKDTTSSIVQPNTSDPDSPVASEASAPTPTTTTPPPDDTNSSSQATAVPVDQTERPSSEAPDLTTTTSTSDAPDFESTTQPDATTTTKQESDEAASSAEAENKKREVTAIGVEYAVVGDNRLGNSSSVVYANERDSSV